MATRVPAIAVLTALLGALLIAAPAQAATVSATINGVTYEADDAVPSAGATAVSSVAINGPLTIPSQVTIGTATYDVTAIGAYALRNKGITAVTIPATVATIDNFAFMDNSITTVTIPDSVTTIGAHAFRYNLVDTLNLGTGVSTIGVYAFANNKLTTLTVPSNITTIGAYAFRYNLLNTLNLGSVATIDVYAFADNQLASVTIPDTVATVGAYAFRNNVLTTLDLGAGVTTVDVYAFADNQLAALTIPNTVDTIGSYAFRNNLLDTLDLGTGVSTVGVYAFADNRLTTLTIPDSVTTIGSYSFQANLLTDVTLGAGSSTIGVYAFSFNQLTAVTIPDTVDTIGAYAFRNNPLDTLDLGAGVTTIDAYAFSDASLTNVTFPATVTSIGTQAFNNNAGLTDVLFNGNAPTLGGSFALGGANPLVKFYAGATGFTTPTWNGGGITDYSTQSLSQHVVSFDTDGLGTTPGNQMVWTGDTATDPGALTETGYTFRGWFDAAAGGTAFDFTAPINADTTVYAQWDINTYTVTFETHNGDPATTETVDYNTTATQPGDPALTSHGFLGWFDASTGGTEFDFTTPITADVTLHAQWERLPATVTAPDSAQGGTTITVSGKNFEPGEQLEIWLLSTPMQLTTLVTDANGTFSTDVSIPDTVAAGSHTIEVRGATTVTVSSAITITEVLAFTGATPLTMLSIAVGLLFAGLALALYARRRSVGMGR